MPVPADQKLLDLSDRILATFAKIFGEHPGIRPAHGRGIDDAAQQKHIIFDPIPRLAGIEPSDDPLLDLRAAVYLISGRKRRAA
jgi:hypothetical protein